MNQHLENAKRLLGIADSGDARKEAYREAAEEIAAYKEETPGTSNNAIAMALDCSRQRVDALLKWRTTGYEADTPYLMDATATTRARVSHAKAVMRDPGQLKTTLDSLTEDERTELIEATVKQDPQVIERVVAKPTEVSRTVRQSAESDENRRVRERFERNREAGIQAQQPTPLSQFLHRMIGTFQRTADDLGVVREEMGTLDADGRVELSKVLRTLIESAQATLDACEGKDPQPEVIEGTVTKMRKLSA